MDALDEITSQHGLLRSWSIEGHLAFPHLCFQEYLASKALRDRPDGHRELIHRKVDPYWSEVIRLYASQGDTSLLVEGLLAERDNVLHYSLFLAASCIRCGAKVSRTEIRAMVIRGLEELARGSVAYLATKAIYALADLGGPEADAFIRSLVRDQAGKLRGDSRASAHVLKLEGERSLEEVMGEFIHSDDIHDPLLESIRWLPQRKAQACLERLITTDEYPVATSKGGDPYIRHRRRTAARLLAGIGEWESVPILLRALRAPGLDDFERAGIVEAIGSVQHDGRRDVLERILNDPNLPTDCRIAAAAALGESHDGAGHYLRNLASNPEADALDRRDAVRILCGFELSDSDTPVFSQFLFDDRPGVFWGGPSFAAKALAKIGTPKARDMLHAAVQYWSKSPSSSADTILECIAQELCHLGSGDRTEQELVTLTSEPSRGTWTNYPDLLLDYYWNQPRKATELICGWLDSYEDTYVLAATRVGALYRILERVQITPTLARSLVQLARRLPQDNTPWAALDETWHRWDLSSESRSAFYSSNST